MAAGDLEAAKAAVAAGADVTMYISGYGHCFTAAISRGNAEIVRYLHGVGGKRLFEKGPYDAAVSAGDLKMLELLLALEPDTLNIRSGYSERTPLHHAAYYGNKEAVVFLLSHGAGTEIRDGYRQTAMQVAEERKHSDIVHILRPYMQKDLEESLRTLREKEEPASQEEVWRVLSPDRVAHVHRDVVIGYRITDIFNFKTRERTTLCRNLETDGESAVLREFKLLEQEVLQDAFDRLVALGGRPDPQSIAQAGAKKVQIER